MSNWGFESLEEWLQQLKLANCLHIHVKNENDPWCLQPQFSQLLFGQISKVRTVLKSSEPADFRTDLTFWIWWKFEVVMAKIKTLKYFYGHGVVRYRPFFYQPLLHPPHPLIFIKQKKNCSIWSHSVLINKVGPDGQKKLHLRIKHRSN